MSYVSSGGLEEGKKIPTLPAGTLVHAKSIDQIPIPLITSRHHQSLGPLPSREEMFNVTSHNQTKEEEINSEMQNQGPDVMRCKSAAKEMTICYDVQPRRRCR